MSYKPKRFKVTDPVDRWYVQIGIFKIEDLDPEYREYSNKWNSNFNGIRENTDFMSYEDWHSARERLYELHLRYEKECEDQMRENRWSDIPKGVKELHNMIISESSDIEYSLGY